jgi:hypothetical protein
MIGGGKKFYGESKEEICWIVKEKRGCCKEALQLVGGCGDARAAIRIIAAM